MAGRCLHPDDVRPNPTLGSYYYVPYNHSGERTGPDLHMLVAYRFPPSIHFRPGVPAAYRIPYPTFAPGSYIGPVVGVDHSSLTASVLIDNHWVTIWSCHPEPQPTGPPLLFGTHHLRPVPASQLGVTGHFQWEPWDHPFQDLWFYTRDIGISHVVEPGRHAPPRFLLTGPAWFRLFNVREFIRHNSDPRGGLPAADLRALARMLHLHLDYPPIAGVPLRGIGIAPYQQMDLIPRARIQRFLRGWIHRRRRARAEERRRLIHADAILPPRLLSFVHVVQSIAEYL